LKNKKAKGTETRNVIKSFKTSERSFAKKQIEKDLIEHYDFETSINDYKTFAIFKKKRNEAKRKKILFIEIEEAKKRFLERQKTA
jgi:hypothetical protein